MKHGTVYWFTGLSGAGKTTIGRLFYEKLKQKRSEVIFLDGDTLREVFGNDLGYTIEERKKSAMRNSRLCRMIAEQGIDVVCATISMFDECRQWNRDNIERYREIYIRVSIDILIQRDQKQLYSKAIKGEIKNVMGVDTEIEEPKFPDIIVNNDGVNTPEEIVDFILNHEKREGYL